MLRLSINTDNANYPLFIGTDILPKIAELFSLYKFNSNVLAIIDKKLADGYTTTLRECFVKNKISISEIYIESGETNKNLLAVHEICRKVLQFNHAPSTVIAFGGGVTTDVAGFSSKILGNADAFIQIPTTVVAQIFSATSNKAFINIDNFPNSVFITFNKHLVLSDIGLLRTLPQRELFSGLGFMLQLAVNGNAPFYHYLIQNFDRLLILDFGLWEEAIFHACTIRQHPLNVSNVDTTKYNFGTFIVRAFEKFSDSQLLNSGEALILGMMIELLTAYKLNICDENYFETLFSCLRIIKPRINPTAIDISNLIHELKIKLQQHPLSFPKKIGEVTTCSNIDETILFDAIEMSLKN